MSKMRIWDIKELFEAYKHAKQIVDCTEEYCKAKDMEDLPKDSVIPTPILYDLSACYVAAYELLLERSIVDNAGLKKTLNLH